MSSRFPERAKRPRRGVRWLPATWTASVVAATALSLGACRRGAQGSEAHAPETGLTRPEAGDTAPGVQPGINPAIVLGAVRNPYTGNASAIASGRQFFVAMNCAGCHSGYAGGGMGPSLRDSLWLYGKEDVQIFSTIAEGRPNGMPAWGARLPEDVIWRIVAYIKTLGTPDEPQKPPVPSQTKVREAPERGERPA
jgi:cytochrome c oxidase cbb3-type subunit III